MECSDRVWRNDRLAALFLDLNAFRVGTTRMMYLLTCNAVDDVATGTGPGIACFLGLRVAGAAASVAVLLLNWIAWPKWEPCG